MRHLCSLLLGSGLLAAAAAASASFVGCGVDCHTTLTCGDPPLGAGGAGGEGAGTGGAGGCDPGKTQGLIDDACGVFVRVSGDDADSGTKASPVATFARAIEIASEENKPVYACAEVFSEAVVVPAGTVLYGGLDCAAGWAYVGDKERTKIAPPTGEIPLKLVKGGSGKTRLVDIIAEAAPAAPGSGGSSIAAIVSDAIVSFERCDFIARDGADGAPGKTPDSSVGPMEEDNVAIRGNRGTNACEGDAAGNQGAPEKVNQLCSDSRGGAGGTGHEMFGGAGKDGVPLPVPNTKGYGLGGAGAMGASGCMEGQSSNLGAPGVAGAGATELGTVSLSGYTGVAGFAGEKGAHGQGGGGGGGAKGKAGCYGASGGSGGSGGCGGGGGSGGEAGGSSIALISLGASLTFKSVKLTAGSGGSGGSGASGQAGGIGGIGGAGGTSNAGTPVGCIGGKGGPGGPGGRGGGGRGGHSIGIAFTGAAPSLSGAAITTLIAGKGGAGAALGGVGADGVVMSAIAFD